MSLSEKLAEIREGSKERIPAKIREEMDRAVTELRESGIADRALREGDSVPEFELPNIAGEKTGSAGLFRPAGLVITFYRGVW